ncbi:hypothetical protein BDA96_04G187000 [Sorghum bicolor]|uniref:Uncharacterized protein n=2 Tax=Sorghum bicolor TaxID=4558 RepID=A0A921R3K9_SORBI|nr:hypothetical protein BDA96_04G187000 [Sorghum bicolor]KXG30394.1 hypothetical protein SORBI_3004G174500 [Sorghum bicolor]
MQGLAAVSRDGRAIWAPRRRAEITPVCSGLRMSFCSPRSRGWCGSRADASSSRPY